MVLIPVAVTLFVFHSSPAFTHVEDPRVDPGPYNLHTGYYLAKKGDTFYKIARGVYGDPSLWPILYQLNPDFHPHYIPVGAMIRLFDPSQLYRNPPSPQPEPTPSATPMPIAIPTPMPTIPTPAPIPTPLPTPEPFPSPVPLPSALPGSSALKQEVYKSQLKVMYQPSFYQESLVSKNIQVDGQVANGLGAEIQVLPHENVMISGYYQRRFNVLERQGTKEQAERLQQQGKLGLNYVTPLPPVQKGKLSMKTGVNAIYNHYQGKTISNPNTVLRNPDYLEDSFQSIGGEVELGLAYLYKELGEPVTLGVNLSYSPYTAIVQDKSKNYGLPDRMQGLGLGMSIESNVLESAINLGLHYLFNYNFGNDFHQSQHQLNISTGYQF